MSKIRKIKATKSHLPTWRAFTAYIGVFTIFVSAIGYSYHLPIDGNISTILTPSVSATGPGPTVDQATALQIAGNIAQRANLPIAANIANLSISLDAESKISKDNTEMISKPKIIKPASDSRKIETYTAKDGDTLQSIADQFNLSVQTIKWANDLNTNTIDIGATLTILPVDGITYTAKEGDTAESIAKKYQSDSAQIVAFNDLELSGIKADQRIIVPNGTLPANEKPGYTTPSQTSGTSVSSNGPATSSSSLVNGYSPIAMTAAGNAYAFGNCTSWVYERRVQLGYPVGSYWGNATTWDSLGRAAGYVVDKTPTVGAVYQMPAFIDAYTGVYGHVGIVESVNPDGSIYVSDMNYAGNFNRVTYRTIPAAQAALYNYIH